MKQSSLDEDEEDFPGLLLHQAALWENAELLEDLLEGDQIAHINSQDSWGRTPLHTAAMRDWGGGPPYYPSYRIGVNHTAAMQDSDVYGYYYKQETALHLSAENGFKDNVLLLLAHKSQVRCFSYFQTALHLSAENGFKDNVLLLLAHKSDTALHLSAENGFKDNVLLLLAHKSQVRCFSYFQTALHLSAENGFKDNVLLLLAHKSQVRCFSYFQTALH
ncbi:hypothetical protein WDU94_010964 [Cyamophila willieti]